MKAIEFLKQKGYTHVVMLPNGDITNPTFQFDTVVNLLEEFKNLPNESKTVNRNEQKEKVRCENCSKEFDRGYTAGYNAASLINR